MCPPRPFVLHLVGDVAQRLLDLIGRQARIFKPLRTVRDQRLNLHCFARLDAQHRRRLRIVVSPRHRLRRRLQRVRHGRVHLLCGKRRNGMQNDKAQQDFAVSHTASLALMRKSRCSIGAPMPFSSGSAVWPRFRVSHQILRKKPITKNRITNATRKGKMSRWSALACEAAREISIGVSAIPRTANTKNAHLSFSSRRISSTASLDDACVHYGCASHGWVMSSGLTRASNSSAVT